MPNPQSVTIAEDVDPDRIAASAVLCPGTRLEGETLSLGPETILGGETPATVISCQTGRGVSLKGGYFEGSVFLDGSSVGSSAHVRPGCLLEEQATVAHAVGLKQTILYPFVTLGSLINFCDVWMTGGTSRKNHSEVGSSFIHFNFTPHGDKATASLVGDPAKGLLLNQPPIFLGGQGGLVGPISIAHGVVMAAGSISRRDLDEPGHLYQSATGEERWHSYEVGSIREPEERIRKNLRYIGALVALRNWYREVRAPVMLVDGSSKACVEGAVRVLTGAIQEREKQLRKLLDMIGGYEDLAAKLETLLSGEPEGSDLRNNAAEMFPKHGSYLERIQSLSPEQGQALVESFQNQQEAYTMLVNG